ncbi:MAG: ABC transporter ATP-binding protein [Desulfobacula sp.]|uniref:ABC transporter ATP-binding protein n=1 Tax=Desulfobacula sp. TaxID=2593537 RepID=UPI0025C30D91|nr:ABC transporter ATP-binding protein [Desulfobacula sp.]MCD4718363.1 ABC transporter ATP-binding protein [Desulfobacula sp.]
MSILCNSVYKKFNMGLGKSHVTAVSNVSFEVNPGEVFGIVGPNGAGKSTLLKMFMGFIRPSSGVITLFGKSPSNPEARISLGYLPENPCFYEHLSAIELMKFSATVSGLSQKNIDEEILRLLRLMDIEHAGKRKLRGYSKGMVQRAGICFALIHDPDLIILDEPMSGLDPVGRKLLVDLILNLKQEGKTILFCSHILNDVERLCDRIAIMHSGELKTILTKQDLTEKGNQVTLTLKAVSIEAFNEIASLGVNCIKKDKITKISCSQKQLNKIINISSRYGIQTSNLEISSNTLEKLFLNTIDDEKVEEHCYT